MRPRRLNTHGIVREVRDHIPCFLVPMLETLADEGYQVYLVGGVARDILSGCEPRDWDLATSALPADVIRLFSPRYRIVDVGVKHGTVTVIASETPVEITTFRAEGEYSDFRRPDSVRFIDDVQADLSRRDFTVNAIAVRWPDGAVLDPFLGLKDLKRGILRAVGEPGRRFGEDPLRMARALRFVSEYGWKLERRTRQAIKEAAPLLKEVAVERVRDELEKTLTGRQADLGLQEADATGLLPYILPEFHAAVEKARSLNLDRYLRRGFFEHAVFAAMLVRPEVALRLAALLHDVGKPYTFSIAGRRPRFHGHDKLGAEIAGRELTRLRFDLKTQERVTLLVREHMFSYGPPLISDAGLRRLIGRAGRENVLDLLDLREADIVASGGVPGPLFKMLRARIQEILQGNQPVSARDLAVNGNDVMKVLGIPQGPLVGLVLRELLEMVLDDPSVNQREVLIAAMPGVLQRLTGEGAARATDK